MAIPPAAFPGGKAAVWRSGTAANGDALSDGLPQKGAYLGVLREAMATDDLETPGVYFGTSTGQVFGSNDEGDHWSLVADYLPPIWVGRDAGRRRR